MSIQLLQGSSKDLGGFSVARLLPQLRQRAVGSFIFLDHMGPADFKPGQGVNVRPHPHIGLSTVTYLFEGEIIHRDSLGYTQAITSGFNQQLALEQVRRITGQSPAPALDLRTRVWFNPDLESRNFIVPGIMAVIMGLIAALLTSLTIAREWERGTMEQLISTPVKPAELILGKLLPYSVIGLANMVIAVLMAVYLFDVPLRGSVPLLFAVGMIFVVGTLAQGILISTVAKQQLLASQFAMISTFLPAFLLSGFAFAIANMPLPVQGITYIVPARYFVALVKGIFLRGVGLETLWRDALFLVVFALIVTAIAIRKTRKRLG